jgi:hypothetical protein
MSNGGRQSWGTTIFCDDIRAEIGGKVTLVGIYTGELVVHAPFPFMMPKFGLWINYFEVPGSISGDGKLHVTLPGDEKPSIETDIPMDQLRSQALQKLHKADDPEVDRWAHLVMPLVFAPLVLRQPGRILVRMHFGESIIRLGALEITGAPSDGNESPL